MNLDFTAIVPSIPYILKGIGVTLQIAIGASIIGFIVGILLALCKIGKVNFLRWFADFYTSIFRGTPLVLQCASAPESASIFTARPPENSTRMFSMIEPESSRGMVAAT